MFFTGCSARAATAFPHLYNIPADNKFPEKPYSMMSKPFYQKYPSNKKYYPGLNITLKAPITGMPQFSVWTSVFNKEMFNMTIFECF